MDYSSFAGGQPLNITIRSVTPSCRGMTDQILLSINWSANGKEKISADKWLIEKHAKLAARSFTSKDRKQGSDDRNWI
jgi:hypothetical protein